MKQFFVSVAKWSWFGLLMLIAFGYMASGLSEPSNDRRGEVEAASDVRLDGSSPSTVPESADLESAAGSPVDSPPREPSAQAESIVRVTAAVNAARNEQLAAFGLQSAPPADWMASCRRMSLALIGSGVSLQEIRGLESLPEDRRESTHLSNLLRDPRFHDYWAERWTRFIVGADEGPFIVYRRRRFRHWLSDELAANRPYDQIVRDLITAEGLWTDRPEVNFLTVTFDSNDGNPDPIRLAARTSRAFLGLRIDCLQCHNDFLGNVNLGDPVETREGRQQDFHQLAAFYSSAKTNGLQGVRTGEADYEYQYLDESETVEVTPAVPYAAELLPEEGDARSRLATWVTHRDNRQFSRAAVARFWALMFGRSATEAVDNLPLDEPLPPMLEPIVDDFVQHRDVRRTIRIIAQSDAFRADSRAAFDVTPQHEERYAVFPLTRLRAEQVAGSIVQASKIKAINRDSSLLVQLIRYGSINDFLERFGDLGENEFSKDGITIPQRLLMINGNMLREAGQLNPILNATGHINLFARDNAQAIETIFLCLLNRYPNAEERDYFIETMTERSDRGEALEDLYWTLANSTEFTWNH
ncbi:DUF1549 and DUF1553 domain-containing protein [Stieleria sp. ICT_E10.1]|uniref:DUF1549 and DUF1553 domain-containing protein n=1 Tax=Stieleria sedimenti TaxID=2976331 RepID=UPI0021804499|nr:DUF1549 and DUF1553 domain-containing protein [Stieleria sedimenti]MCS7467298.1 DUF1549 and DUF1553 domain-containing protein [Stieleria sedimenti]